MSDERLPPNDRDAERALLGMILRDPSQFEEAATVLRPEDFYQFCNQLIFASMADARQKGRNIDMVAMASAIRDAGKSEDAPAAYFAELWADAPILSDPVDLARIVKNHASARELITACADIAKEAWQPGLDAAALLEDAERRIFAIAQRDLRGDIYRQEKVIDESLGILDRRVTLHREGRMTGLGYGLIDLDVNTAGLHPGELVVIAARPGVGKTIFGAHLADVTSMAGKPALFVSLEQSRHELALRLLAKHSGVNAFKIRGGSISNDDKTAILFAAEKMRGAALCWDDCPTQTIGRIAAQARRMKSKYGLELLVVDYLQLMESANKRQKRHEAVGEISRGLKLLSRDLNVPVVAMAQLNRDSEAERREPRLSDLRESGSIEQDADTVILMHLPTAEPGSAMSQIKLLIRKQRNGPLTDVFVMHDKARYALCNVAHEPRDFGS